MRLVKVVRSLIPDIVGDQVVHYDQIPGERIKHALRAKLLEEVGEYIMEPSVEELSDVLEVIHALADIDLAVPFSDIEYRRISKAMDAGAIRMTGLYVRGDDR